MAVGASASDEGQVNLDGSICIVGGCVINPVLIASHISGTSPMTVNFTTFGTIATGYGPHEVWRQFGYRFDYGDPGSGTFNVIRGGSRNQSVGGPKGIHTYSVPDGGGTVEFTTTVFMESPDGSLAQATVNISVTAQDAAHTPANTLLISSTLDTTIDWSTLGFDKSPPSVPEANRRNTVPAFDELNGKRVMYHRESNASFSAETQYIEYGQSDISFDDFGNNADPFPQLNSIWWGCKTAAINSTSANNTDAASYGNVWIERCSMQHFRIAELHTGMGYQHITTHDCDMDFENQADGGFIEIGRSAAWCWQDAELDSSNVPYPNGFYLSETRVIGSRAGAIGNLYNTNMYMNDGGANIGIVGCTVNIANEHNVRLMGAYEGAIMHSDILGNHIGNNGNKSGVTLRGKGYLNTINPIGQMMNFIPDPVTTIKSGMEETEYDGTGTSGSYVGGSGFSVGDVPTFPDGLFLTVTSETGGVVDGFIIDAESYTGAAADAQVINQSGGPGSGFVLTLGLEDIGTDKGYPCARRTVVQTCSMSAGDEGEATWTLQMSPGAATGLQWLEDFIGRDIDFIATPLSPANNSAVAGTYMTITENTGSGAPINISGQERLNNIDLGNGVPSLQPVYINETPVPTP